jgi:methionyl aminopeptidase
MTTLNNQVALEQTGEGFSTEQLLEVRTLTRSALWNIADHIVPGMTEEEGRSIATEILRDAGLRKGWHKILVRFGANTTKNFDDPSEFGVTLADDDIFFIDIGPIRDGCEGDAGDTFTVGTDPEMGRAADEVKDLWKLVREKWRAEGLSGAALYTFAEKSALDLGWQLDLELTGHRLSEFPHSAHYDGTLSTVIFRPSDLLWVLEIQIRHPEREFGAFFEDLLLEDDELQGTSYGRPH